MKARLVALTVAVAVAAIVAGAIYFVREDKPSPAAQRPTLACRFRVGESLSYRLHAQSTSTAGTQRQQLALGGVLHWHVLKAEGAKWLIASALDEVTLEELPVAAPEARRAAFSEPFLFEIGRDCRFGRIAFAPKSDLRVRGQIVALLRSMEIALPFAPVMKWSATQQDVVGSYVGRYEASAAPNGVDVSRTKGSYSPNSSGALNQLVTPSIDVVRSEAHATLALSGAWVESLALRDELKVSLGGRLLTEVAGSVELTRMERTPLLSLAGLDPDRFQFKTGLETEEVALEPTPPDESLAKASLDEALADFERRLRAGRAGLLDAVSRLAGYLGQRPEAISELMERLGQGRVAAELHSALFLALERTGTPQAESALAKGLRDGRLSGVDRSRAAVALADVPHPSSVAVDALVSQSRRRGGVEEEEVSRSALLALGSLGRNAAPTQPELAAKIREELTSQLQSKSPEAVTTALDAAGNAGDPALFKHVETLTNDPSVLVRSHAAAAYRRGDSSSDEAKLLEWLGREPAVAVRRSIVGSLAERSATAGGRVSQDVVAAAIQRLPGEPDARVRGVLIGLLGSVSATELSAKQTLVAQFHRESEPELKQLIGRYCSADELR